MRAWWDTDAFHSGWALWVFDGSTHSILRISSGLDSFHSDFSFVNEPLGWMGFVIEIGLQVSKSVIETPSSAHLLPVANKCILVYISLFLSHMIFPPLSLDGHDVCVFHLFNFMYANNTPLFSTFTLYIYQYNIIISNFMYWLWSNYKSWSANIIK